MRASESQLCYARDRHCLATHAIELAQPHVAREGQATFLTPEDHIRLHALVTDVAFKVVVPHIERVAQTRNENVRRVGIVSIAS